MEEGQGGEFPPKKSQSETQVSGADFPAKKLARQLDFTGGTARSVVFPEHPQPQVVSAKIQTKPAVVEPSVLQQQQLTTQPSLRVA